MAHQIPPLQSRRLDPKIWGACAGVNVKVPTLDSRVYYFPEGHMEQASSLPPPKSLSPLLLSRPSILCSVTAAQFFAHSEEFFAVLSLVPITAEAPIPPVSAAAATGNGGVASFEVVLSQTHTYGLYIPETCVSAIFPEFQNTQSSEQSLTVRDVHGNVWNFIHSFTTGSGGGRHHSLTEGWMEFAKGKNLVANDTVIFVKNSIGDITIGIRRTSRRFSSSLAVREGKFSPESVVAAAELAAQNEPFQVVYYTKPWDWSDFVVKAEVVDESLTAIGEWSRGMAVKTPFDPNLGNVSIVFDGDTWQGSPWRKLFITWNPLALIFVKDRPPMWLSPWEAKPVKVVNPYWKGEEPEGCSSAQV